MSSHTAVYKRRTAALAGSSAESILQGVRLIGIGVLIAHSSVRPAPLTESSSVVIRST